MRNRTRFTVRATAATIGALSAVAFGAAEAGGSAPAQAGVPARAPAHCHFQPHFPARVSAGQDVVGVVGRLTITGTGCTHQYDVSTRLIHETDEHGYSWTTPYTVK